MEVNDQLNAPTAFHPVERTPSVQRIGVWMGRRAGIALFEIRKCLDLSRFEPRMLSLYWLRYQGSFLKVRLNYLPGEEIKILKDMTDFN